ncbi:hypothetical protein PsYK624_055590 [Phanerochaete sordida]|uniref:Protein CPL1-like domain-containing protein n=1 Tax=Phanerochaete sordida TaxID=48140 RepID=A0A9P3LCP5_9APHY|nr:hypothetical protein PsYK624_055590 [Phanerochaete sordida]
MRFFTPGVFAAGVGFLSLASSSNARAAYKLRSRTTTDVCANIDADLSVDVFGIAITVGLIDVCLCLSAIPVFIKTNVVAIAGITLVGEAAVEANLEAMVNNAPDHQSCIYPDNCDPICSHGSPCGFQCKNGFVLSPDHKDCICPAPNKVCNGICGPFKSCPSSGPKKREDLERRVSCGAGQTACGVYGWQGFNSVDAWECIDTKTDLESCGGCMVPFGRTPAHGIDCTAIPGVMDVNCISGSCVVRRCQPGYVLSLDNTFCLEADRIAKLKAGDIPAALYGLEHVPLQKKSA